MKIASLTAVGWCANMMLDRRAQAPFTFDDIYAASDNGRLVDLLLKIDEDGMLELMMGIPGERADLERAPADAAAALRGREMRKTGVGDNVLCLVMALMLEAIQQRFRR